MKKELTVSAKTLEEAIEKAGGTVTVLEQKTK